jgi:hypothetical protein
MPAGCILHKPESPFSPFGYIRRRGFYRKLSRPALDFFRPSYCAYHNGMIFRNRGIRQVPEPGHAVLVSAGPRILFGAGETPKLGAVIRR